MYAKQNDDSINLVWACLFIFTFLLNVIVYCSSSCFILMKHWYSIRNSSHFFLFYYYWRQFGTTNSGVTEIVFQWNEVKLGFIWLTSGNAIELFRKLTLIYSTFFQCFLIMKVENEFWVILMHFNQTHDVRASGKLRVQAFEPQLSEY